MPLGNFNFDVEQVATIHWLSWKSSLKLGKWPSLRERETFLKLQRYGSAKYVNFTHFVRRASFADDHTNVCKISQIFGAIPISKQMTLTLGNFTANNILRCSFHLCIKWIFDTCTISKFKINMIKVYAANKWTFLTVYNHRQKCWESWLISPFPLLQLCNVGFRLAYIVHWIFNIG